MPLYETPQQMIRVVDGVEEVWSGGVVRVHTEQDWAEVVDLEAEPGMDDMGNPVFATKRIRGLFYVPPASRR